MPYLSVVQGRICVGTQDFRVCISKDCVGALCQRIDIDCHPYSFNASRPLIRRVLFQKVSRALVYYIYVYQNHSTTEMRMSSSRNKPSKSVRIRVTVSLLD